MFARVRREAKRIGSGRGRGNRYERSIHDPLVRFALMGTHVTARTG